MCDGCAYRMSSIAWEPHPPHRRGRLSRTRPAWQSYDDVFDELKAHGIEPIVTLS